MKINIVKSFLVLVITLLLFSSICFGLGLEKSELDKHLNPDFAGRIVLVGFHDHYINRMHGSSLSTGYRRRGEYQSSSWSQRITSQIAQDYQLQKLTEWPMTEVSVHCVVYLLPESFSINAVIEQLSQDKRVQIVQRMNIFNTESHIINDPYYELQTNMQSMQIDKAHMLATGRDITIAMIDTGVDFNHPDLQGQISKNENFAFGISSSFENDLHGTAVAGLIVARKNNDTGIIGVAPDAKLVALKACWPVQENSIESQCNSFTIALAINKAIKDKVNILNLSLSGPKDPLVELLINKALEMGMIVVAADSNSGLENKGFPASLKNIISVQTVKKQHSLVKTLNPSICAPGEKILTTIPYGTYDFISGSSLATAQVSGIIALLLQLKPSLTLAEIKSLLLKSELTEQSEVDGGVRANNALLSLCATITCPKSI